MTTETPPSEPPEAQTPGPPPEVPATLNLDGDQPRGPQIQIQGKLFELKTPDQFTMAESARVRRMVREMQARLAVIDDLDIAESDEQFTQAINVLDSEAQKLLDLVLPLPDDVVLTTEQKMQALAFFTTQSWAQSNPSLMSAISRQESPSGTE